MKIEFEVRDITREEVVEAIASAMLKQMVSEWDDFAGSYERVAKSPLAEQLEKLIDAKVTEVTTDMVRACFDEKIHKRIADTIDEVLAVGWVKTDNYGNATGASLDLKGRINEIITEKKSTGYNRESRTLAEKLVAEKVHEVLTRELNAEIEKARASLRSQLDAVVAGKVAETIKQALGLR